MSTDAQEIRRGDVFVVDLNPVVGHEQGGLRPFLLISVDAMNRSVAEMTIGVPLTTTDRSNRLQVRLDPPEAGLSRVSFAMPEMIRSISKRRLRRRLGHASADTVEAVAKHTGILTGLARSR